MGKYVSVAAIITAFAVVTMSKPIIHTHSQPLLTASVADTGAVE
jgi:hypothetical protein